MLTRFVRRPAEEVALATSWIFLVGGLVWLVVYVNGSTLLGFGEPWTWLAASHFAAAGFGALTVTALSCRVVSAPRALNVLRVLLVLHPLTYLVTAAGISGYRYCDELGATSYQLLFATQLGAVLLGRPYRMARAPCLLLVLALVVPVLTLLPALAWAWGRPIFDLWGMVRYHGLVNAIGHVGAGLLACVWGRPPAHSAAPSILSAPTSS
jgi:YndJ-like protein